MNKLRTLCLATVAACALPLAGWAQTPDYSTRYDGVSRGSNESQNHRYIKTVTVSADGKALGTVDCSTYFFDPLYNDKHATDTVTVVAGSTLTVNIGYMNKESSNKQEEPGKWMHGYAYVDKDGDGFSYDVDNTTHKPLATSDLVSYNAYSFGGTGDYRPWWNSNGEQLPDANPFNHSYDLPTFVAPTKVGTYRMRVKVDWDNIDPKGSERTVANNIYDLGGGILDFTLKVVPAPQLPYTIDFKKSTEGWTGTSSDPSASWTQQTGLGVKIESDNVTADYKSPVFTLEAGKSYLVTTGYWTYLANPADKLSLYVAPEGGTETLLKNYPVSEEQILPYKEEAVFIPTVSGDYRFDLRFECNATEKGGNPLFIQSFDLRDGAVNLPTTTAEGYATYYATRAITLPAGVTATTVTKANPNADGTSGTLETPWQYNGDDAAKSTVPAGTAVLFKGEASHTYTGVLLSTAEGVKPATNLLHGADAVNTDSLTDIGEDAYYYILSYEEGTETETTPGKNLGFYWATDDGSAVKYHSPFAFLAIPKADAANVKAFSFDPHTTGITTVVDGQANQPAAIYTLTGRRVNAASVNGLEKGIYIVNGKKVLVK